VRGDEDLVLGLIVRRLLSLIPLLLVVSFAVFSLTYLLPGDPATTMAGGTNASPQDIVRIRKEYGFNDPLVTQYVRWLKKAVKLDFGRSLIDHKPVSGELRRKFPVTLSLTLAAMVIGLMIGLPLGIMAGMRPGSARDKAGVGVASLGIAIPNFWLAMVLITIFAIDLGWFPAIGWTNFQDSPSDWLKHVFLPALALGVWAAAALARQLRSGLIDTLDTNYVRTAWAKGSRERRVVGKHALKNAAIPAVTVFGLSISTLLGGAVIIERIFSIPGLGTYLLAAISSYDIPVIQGVTVLFVLMFVVINLIIDISYGYFNPRVRVS
jgi:peptide/nickel transport system permease protein